VLHCVEWREPKSGEQRVANEERRRLKEDVYSDWRFTSCGLVTTWKKANKKYQRNKARNVKALNDDLGPGALVCRRSTAAPFGQSRPLTLQRAQIRLLPVKV
jgi:hypothetical protein